MHQYKTTNLLIGIPVKLIAVGSEYITNNVTRK